MDCLGDDKKLMDKTIFQNSQRTCWRIRYGQVVCEEKRNQEGLIAGGREWIVGYFTEMEESGGYV